MSVANSSSTKGNTIDLSLLFFSRITRSLAAGALAVAIPLYFKESLHYSYLLIGILFAGGAFASPVLSYLFGLLGDLYGRKKMLLVGQAILPIAVFILLLPTNYPLLFISTTLGGFGIAGGLVGGGVGAFVAPMQMALLAEKSNNENRTTVYTAFTMFSNFAGSLGALILVVLTNYNDMFVFTLFFTIISFLSIIPLKETFKPQQTKKKNLFKASNITQQDKSVIKKFVLTGIFNGLTQGLVTPFLPIILNQNFSLSDAEVGTVIAIGGILTTIMMIITPYMTKRLGFVNYIIVSRSISAIFVLIFPFSPSALIAVGSYFIFTISRAVSIPSQLALMMNLVSERARSEATGTNQAARLFPLATSTTLSGDILDAMPLYVSFALAFVVSVINIVLYQIFFGNIEFDEEKAQAGAISR